MKKQNLYLLLLPAIFTCAAVLLASLYIAFRPLPMQISKALPDTPGPV